jgi:hypothetical protein
VPRPFGDLSSKSASQIGKHQRHLVVRQRINQAMQFAAISIHPPSVRPNPASHPDLPPRPCVSYSRHMVEILTTQVFDRWLRKLKDRQARLRIVERIDRLTHGNPGDTKPVGQGVWELRLTYSPGLPGLLPARRRPSGPAVVRRRQVDPTSRHQPGTPVG